ncbi:hypothetical protein JCM1841_001031, partial [Sporobolomyces salmonicolor]
SADLLNWEDVGDELGSQFHT